MTITENISLKEFTTFRIGGPAKFFCAVKNIEELKAAVSFAKEKKLAIFVLGGGSNIVISDNGFAGLVIKIEISGIEEKIIDSNTTEIISGAGEVWDELVAYAVNKNLHGIENLSLIPGSVGAAPVQNIGAYGMEAKESIAWVEAFNTETEQVEILKNSECMFAYRDSIFKKDIGKIYIITRVAFVLSKDAALKTEYRDVAAYIQSHDLDSRTLTLKNVRDIVIDIRTNKLPDVKLVGTAGSFFKNPIIPVEKYEELKSNYPEMPNFPAGEQKVKVPAAWMLDKLCGFKGYRDGEVGIYKNQALVLVNYGNATAQDIINLAEKMIACVKEKTEITLEKEVQIIN